jgi:hypothetical protein
MRTYILIAFIAILALVHPTKADTPAAAPVVPAQEQARTLTDDDLKVIADAAQGGDAAAQGHLGALYALGTDVPQNYGHAFFLLTLAKINGEEKYEDIRKGLLKVLTRDTAAALSRRAHGWKPGMEVSITQEGGEAAPMIVKPPEDSYFTKFKKYIKLLYFNQTVDY